MRAKQRLRHKILWIKALERKYKVDLTNAFETDMLDHSMSDILAAAINKSDLIKDKEEEYLMMKTIINLASSKVGIYIKNKLISDIDEVLDLTEEDLK